MHREVGQYSDSSAGRSRISFVTCIPRVLSRVNCRTTEILASIHPWLTGERLSCLTVRCDPSSWEWSENTSRNLSCKGTAAVWQNEDDCSFQVPLILIETLANVCSHACRARERTSNYSGKVHLCINILIRKHGSNEFI